MAPRVRLVFGILAFAVLLPIQAFADAVQVVPGTAYYQNIQTALKFLREHGEGAAADEIKGRLDQGKIYVEPVDANGETDPITGTISIDPGTIGHNNNQKMRDTPLDPEKDFASVVGLARTLYHENIHSNHQSILFNVIFRKDGREHFAWTYAILALERWIMSEWDASLDVLGRPLRPGMTPADHARELDHIKQKINVLRTYIGSYKENDYFGYDEGPWANGVDQYWVNKQEQYIDPELNKLRPKPTDESNPPSGGGTPATPTTPVTPETPKTEPPKEEPQPEPQITVITCAPCQKIADQIRDVKERLKTLNENAQKADDAVVKNQQRIANLQKRVANLQAELARGAGTGGKSYDPATGQTIEAYDQGNGKVKVTTKDRAGNTIEEHERDSSARKAEINKQITETNAEIAKAQADGKNLETAAATAKKLVSDMAALLEQLVKELEDCIKKYCTNLSTSDALNMLNLPYESLDVLKDPTSYNPFDGNTNGAFQQMIIEIRVGNAPGMTVPRGASAPSRGALEDFRQPRTMLAALLSWLRPNTSAWVTPSGRWSGEPRRPWSIEPAAERQRGQRNPFRQPVQMLLTSLGQSTGQAFDLQVFNGTGQSFKLAAQSLVVEALKDEVKQQVQRGMQQLIGSTANPIAARINGYCLEMLKLPPVAGTLFKIASPELQKRFEPMRKIMDASRRVQQLGQLRPDSNPDGYFHSIRQWAMWAVEQKLNDKSFANAFVDYTRKQVTANKQQWTKQTEDTVKQAAPNRWNDIQRVLSAAGVPLPR